MRAKPRRAAGQRPSEPLLLSRAAPRPEEVRGEEEEEEEQQAAALLQRKKLLQDLGLEDQIRRLLQGEEPEARPDNRNRTDAANTPPSGGRLSTPPSGRLSASLFPPDSGTLSSQRAERQQASSQLRPAGDQKSFNQSVCLQHDSTAAAAEQGSAGAQQITWSVSGSLAARQDRSRPAVPVQTAPGSSLTPGSSVTLLTPGPRSDPAAPGPRSDPAALQSLLVISSWAPLLQRPGFPHGERNSSRRDPRLGKGQ